MPSFYVCALRISEWAGNNLRNTAKNGRKRSKGLHHPSDRTRPIIVPFALCSYLQFIALTLHLRRALARLTRLAQELMKLRLVVL